MSLQAASEARKERLIALKRRKEGHSTDSNGEFRFRVRNYDPETKTIAKHKNMDEEQDTVEKAVEGVAEMIITEDEERRNQQLDIFNIAPKRPNWDLKRDLEKKLGKMERSYQEAIHTLIRKRLAAQNGTPDDLSARIRAQERELEDEKSSDEDEE
ncbi:hypothetical protein FRC03_000011 [Tulasnella sp. 419]|nr:hypothetical protein FRC03_000011 [Tulasnella sp. 419]